MPEMTKYPPGQFCWADLNTPDVTAAKRFYGELLGWSIIDTPMPEGGAYSMAQVGKKDVCAMGSQRPEEVKAGVPPHWNAYVNVADADAATKKALSLGGKLVVPTMDVMDVGRMSVVADPSGAAFCLWQAKKHIGASRLGDPGALCWFELATRDTKACTAFYTKLFGWTSEEMDMGDMHYTVFKDGKDSRAGMMPMMKDAPPAMPSNWTVYFAVENCDATAKKATAMGAKTLVPPTDIPNTGRFAIFMDPQGAVFDVLQPAPMP